MRALHPTWYAIPLVGFTLLRAAWAVRGWGLVPDVEMRIELSRRWQA